MTRKNGAGAGGVPRPGGSRPRQAQDTRLYHGGAPGRRPGDLLLPPCETGYPTGDERWREVVTEFGLGVGTDIRALGLEPDRYRDDRVYLTARRDLATAYAAAHNASRRFRELGSLYVAVPVGELEDDPDLPGFSFQCSRARVVAIYDPCVSMSVSRMSRILNSVITIG